MSLKQGRRFINLWLVVTYAKHFSSPYFIQHMGIHLLHVGHGTEQL